MHWKEVTRGESWRRTKMMKKREIKDNEEKEEKEQEDVSVQDEMEEEASKQKEDKDKNGARRREKQPKSPNKLTKNDYEVNTHAKTSINIHHT